MHQCCKCTKCVLLCNKKKRREEKRKDKRRKGGKEGEGEEKKERRGGDFTTEITEEHGSEDAHGRGIEDLFVVCAPSSQH